MIIHPVPTLLIIAGTGLLLGGCGRSFDDQRVDAMRAVQNARYEVAVGEVNDLYDSHDLNEPAEAGGGKKDAAALNEKQALLWHMERGMIGQIAGDWKVSDRHLDEAARLVDDRRTKSLTREIGTVIVNDTLREYAGEAYEHLQVDYTRVLNRLVTAERDSGVLRLTATSLPADRPAQSAPPVPADAGPSPFSPTDLYGQAVGIARRMTINQMQETADAAEGRRYHDDPFARLMAALTTLSLPPADRAESDQQFADVMVKKAFGAYAEMRKSLAGDKNLRYEVPERLRLLDTLLVRVCRPYDPEGFANRAREFGFAADDARLQTLSAPKGMGSVLVLNHVGFITRPEVLSFSLWAGGTATPRPGTSAISMGGVGFIVTGPGHEQVAMLPFFPLPPELVRTILAPGGAAYMGFEIPSHVPDRPIQPPARVVLRNTGAATGEITTTMEVVSDLDAYARSTLKDRQPRLIFKTITRAVAKQVAAGVVTKAVMNHNNQDSPANQLLGAAVNLFTSAAATLSESADIRAWTTLPDHIEASLIDVPPGTWAITIDPGYEATTVATATVRSGCVTILPVRTFPHGQRAPTAKP